MRTWEREAHVAPASTPHGNKPVIGVMGGNRADERDDGWVAEELTLRDALCLLTLRRSLSRVAVPLVGVGQEGVRLAG
jgi:hypothetical protein